MDAEKIKKYLEFGSEVAGAAVGGAIGLIGGPGGAIGGGVAGVSIAKGIFEIANRHLSNREKIRTAASASYILANISRRINAGDTPRADGFFSDDSEIRGSADELFEGILLKCKNEFEEKKIKYISNIYEQVSFNSSITPDTANQILTLANNMTWRRLCILSLAHKNKKNPLDLIDTNFRDNQSDLTVERSLLLQDFHDLSNLGLVERSDESVMLGVVDVTPSMMITSELGDFYVDVMKLYEIDIEEMSYFLGLIKKANR